MIARLAGVVDHVDENTVELNVSGISYEVFIPTAVIKSFGDKLSKGTALSLVTYHYYQTDPSKSIPILIGFANAVEKDFFEKFITVSGVGPKAAVRALVPPIPDIAQAIDAGDLSFLKSLPGIGEQRAKEIIAKLQGKMSRFGLLQDGAKGAAPRAAVKKDIQSEAVEVLLQLQYKKDEAARMVQAAFDRKPGLKTIEDILSEVYRQRKQ